MKDRRWIAVLLIAIFVLFNISALAESDAKGIEITYNGVPLAEVIGTASEMFADAVEENLESAMNGLNAVLDEFANDISESFSRIEAAIQGTAFDYFCYSNTGSSTYEIYSYEVVKDEDSGEWTVVCGLHCGYETYTLPADKELMNKLNEILDEHNLRAWDGFSESDSMVLDGSGFSLDVDFSDGSSIHAHGSNSFPDGFYEAKTAIDEIFHSYLNQNGITPEGGF